MSETSSSIPSSVRSRYHTSSEHPKGSFVSLHAKKPGLLHIFVDSHRDLTICGFRTFGRPVASRSYKGECQTCIRVKESLDGLAE